MLSLFLILFSLIHDSLHAYTDPGTGSMIWQLLMAAGFGLLFYARRIIDWVKSLWSKDISIKDADNKE